MLKLLVAQIENVFIFFFCFTLEDLEVQFEPFSDPVKEYYKQKFNCCDMPSLIISMKLLDVILWILFIHSL
jgi:hypothetical protein